MSMFNRGKPNLCFMWNERNFRSIYSKYNSFFTAVDKISGSSSFLPGHVIAVSYIYTFLFFIHLHYKNFFGIFRNKNAHLSGRMLLKGSQDAISFVFPQRRTRNFISPSPPNWKGEYEGHWRVLQIKICNY